MRLSKFYLYTIKEDPHEAYVVSHKLMLRSGMIKQVAAGIYSWLPMGLLVLNKIKEIVSKHHIDNDINEILMPTIQPSDMWIQSGRFEDYGKEMLKIKDRNKIDLLYGPTNEEMITTIISKDLKSYKELPKILFHTQWKFRDELRPRFGVLRCREFLMKDAYSFDMNDDKAYSSYCKMFALYMKIFKKLGVKVIPVRADSGPIGGGLSHEFIIESKEGESEVFFDKRIYNLAFDNCKLNDDKLVKEYVEKLASYYSCTKEKHKEEEFINKVNDKNQAISKGIEIGHIFYFGTKYSKKLNALYNNERGEKEYIHSGSYGIGISRLVAAIIESNYDEHGIVWPNEVAPFQIGLINIRSDNEMSTNFCENFYKNYHNSTNILYDDRDVRAGEKLNNMDLIGIPVQIIVGDKNLKNNNIEIKNRKSGVTKLVSSDLITDYLKENYEL